MTPVPVLCREEKPLKPCSALFHSVSQRLLSACSFYCLMAVAVAFTLGHALGATCPGEGTRSFQPQHPQTVQASRSEVSRNKKWSNNSQQHTALEEGFRRQNQLLKHNCKGFDRNTLQLLESHFRIIACAWIFIFIFLFTFNYKSRMLTYPDITPTPMVKSVIQVSNNLSTQYGTLVIQKQPDTLHIHQSSSSQVRFVLVIFYICIYFFLIKKNNNN